MSRLSDALGVPEGKPFEVGGTVYEIRGNRRHYKRANGEFTAADSETGLALMLDDLSRIKLLPTKYKRKEPETVDVYRVGDGYVPGWVPYWLKRDTSNGDYIVQSSAGSIKVYTPKEFESTFEEVE